MTISEFTKWWGSHRDELLQNWPILEISTSLNDTWSITYIIDNHLIDFDSLIPNDIEIDDANWMHFCKDGSTFCIHCSSTYVELALSEVRKFGTSYHKSLVEKKLLESISEDS